MKGYRNGDKTLPDVITISTPNAKRIITNGSIHHFFSCLRNAKNSLSNDHIGIQP
jgi:hypothetical protein